jgi:Cu/Ag efflux protein CusF
MLKLIRIAALGALSVLLPVAALAQSTEPMAASATVTLTAKIVAIDHDSRVVTLQDAKGNTQSIQVGPAVKRFDALQVGQTVTFTYQESMAMSISKPGTTVAAQGTPTVTSDAGALPGGTISQVQTATVTITAIDMKTPSITVKTSDGRTISMLVKHPENLAGLKVGDAVSITYSQALAISVSQ